MSNYTFDQNFIQSDRTGNFLTDIKVNARCKAFSGHGIQDHGIQIGADKTLRVWDPIAGHYTTCHNISRPSQRRIIRKFVKG